MADNSPLRKNDKDQSRFSKQLSKLKMPDEDAQDDSDMVEDVPLVSVCVQGGPGSVMTVLEAV